jgi:hypothetical protein
VDTLIVIVAIVILAALPTEQIVLREGDWQSLVLIALMAWVTGDKL